MSTISLFSLYILPLIFLSISLFFSLQFIYWKKQTQKTSCPIELSIVWNLLISFLWCYLTSAWVLYISCDLLIRCGGLIRCSFLSTWPTILYRMVWSSIKRYISGYVTLHNAGSHWWSVPRSINSLGHAIWWYSISTMLSLFISWNTCVETVSHPIM